MLAEIAKNIQLVVFDFDGVFTDNKVLVLDNGQEAVTCNRSDGVGIALLRQHSIDAMVLSQETNPVVQHRCKKLALPCVNSCDDKLVALSKILQEKSLSWSQVAYLGNDINDLTCLQKVAFPVCVADSHEEVFIICKLVTNRAGGQGAVREFCETLIRLR